MTDTRWYYLDTQHIDYNTAKNECEARHEAVSVGTVLSVNLKKDGLESLIKVSGADLAWRQSTTGGWANSVSGVVLGIYDDTNHASAVTMVKDFAWEEPLA